MKRPYQITAVVILLFSAFMVRESLQIRFYTAMGPGPGFFPFWLSVFLGLLAAFMFYHATWGESDPMPADFFASRKGYFRAAAALGALYFCAFAMAYLGFRLTMLIFVVWLLSTLGKVNPILIAVIAALASFGGYWLFDQVLQVVLPVGMFGI
jgi:putative tricarboxylic transport membrane protein